MSKCFICDMRKFVKKWKGLVNTISYGTPKDNQLCEKHLEELVNNIKAKLDKNKNG